MPDRHAEPVEASARAAGSHREPLIVAPRAPAPRFPGNAVSATTTFMAIRELSAAHDPEVLALRALAIVAGDPDLGPRFLDLSGLDAATLRAQAGERSILAAVVGFLSANEADLVRIAAELDVRPEALVAAGTALAR